LIVGIGHKKRRGKDTAANPLVRELGFTKIGFADALKKLAYASNPVVTPEPGLQNTRVGFNRLATLVDRYGWEYVKDHYPLARQFLQDLGQAGRSTFGDYFWFHQWKESLEDIENVVVPDVRFWNEAIALRKLGAVLIRIDRVLPGAADGDISEHDLNEFDDWDLIIPNNGTIDELERTVLDFVRSKAVTA
jgi:hypothetical protein